MQALQTLVLAHWHALMIILAVWIAVATFLARKWPKPATSAKWYAKLGHFALVDLPALAATLNGKTWMGTTISIPFITWTVRDPSDAQKLGALLPPLLLIPVLLSLGCAGGLNGVRESLTVSAKLLQASADTFKAADLDYQRALEKKPDAAYEVNRYRTEVRPKVMKAFVDAAAALSLAQATCAAVEQGAKSKNDLGAVMVQAFAELKAVQDALAAIGILPPSSSTRWRWRPRATRLARLALELALPEFVPSQAVL